VRMALGAEAGTILQHVVGKGVRSVLPGIGVGLLLGALLSPLLAAWLFGLEPIQPGLYVGVGVAMVLVTAAAAAGPAVRASRLQPLSVLRSD